MTDLRAPRRARRVAGAVALTASMLTVGAASLAPGAVSAAPIGDGSYTCSGGSPGSPALVPEGAYGSVTVTGFCYMQGSYAIRHSLTVGPGGVLDAAVFQFFPGVGTPGMSAKGAQPCNVFVSVAGGVEVGTNATLFLGNGAGTHCSSSNDVVNGGLTAIGASTVVVHGSTINGGMSVEGGGGTSCSPTAASPVGAYTDVEDSAVNGAVSFSDVSTCWMGFIRNMDNGTVSITNNTMSDPDAIEIGLNDIHGSLACSGNALAFPGAGGVPTNSFDGSPPNPNTVTGSETGQCAGL